MSLEAVRKDLENSSLPPVYLWYGEDRYSLAEALKILKGLFLEEDPSGSCIEYFPGKNTAPEEIVQAANTLSFFAKRLVIVDDIPYFNQSKPPAGKAESLPEKMGSPDEEESAALGLGSREERELDSILSYLQKPNPAACLVLVSEKVNRGRKLYKEIGKAGKVLEFKFPSGQNEWISWIQNETRARGKSISSSTAAYLVEQAGHHTGFLNQELAKISIFIGERREIQKEDISRVCVPLVETTIFAMLDAIAAGNLAEAVRKLEEVLSREHFLKVHTMIVRQIRLLLAANLVRRQGGTRETFMEITGTRTTFEATKIFRQAGNFSVDKLAGDMEDCLQTELALKSSGSNPHLLLEMMIVRFCATKKAAG